MKSNQELQSKQAVIIRENEILKLNQNENEVNSKIKLNFIQICFIIKHLKTLANLLKNNNQMKETELQQLRAASEEKNYKQSYKQISIKIIKF